MDVNEWASRAAAGEFYGLVPDDSERGSLELIDFVRELQDNESSLDLIESQWASLAMFLPRMIADILYDEDYPEMQRLAAARLPSRLMHTISSHLPVRKVILRNFYDDLIRPGARHFRQRDISVSPLSYWDDLRTTLLDELGNSVSSGILDIQISALQALVHFDSAVRQEFVRRWLQEFTETEAKALAQTVAAN